MPSIVAVSVGSGVKVSVTGSAVVGDTVGEIGAGVGEEGGSVAVGAIGVGVVTTVVTIATASGDSTVGVSSGPGSSFKMIAPIPSIAKIVKIRAMLGMMNFFRPEFWFRPVGGTSFEACTTFRRALANSPAVENRSLGALARALCNISLIPSGRSEREVGKSGTGC